MVQSNLQRHLPVYNRTGAAVVAKMSTNPLGERRKPVRRILVIITAAAFLAGYQLVLGQNRRCRDTFAQRTARDIQERPQLGANYSRVAQFRLASRKRSYRIGEMISLDVAMLNMTDQPIFFHKLSGPAIVIKADDNKGVEIPVTPSSIDLEGVIPQSYLLLNPNEVVVASFQLLAGCNIEGVAAFDEARQRLNEDVRRGQISYDRGVFERNLFLNWGDACLRITQPGKYTITVEMTNQHVIVSPCESKLKTATGSISSASLTITITE